ncbi:hypothetical protein DFJ74DRAFT_444114 [Hyaloraphidium curvatum]|nr:hypothetical protein DFJ74DRAFT_444114 [Hyaloraphidium curvatum]
MDPIVAKRVSSNLRASEWSWPSSPDQRRPALAPCTFPRRDRTPRRPRVGIRTHRLVPDVPVPRPVVVAVVAVARRVSNAVDEAAPDCSGNDGLVVPDAHVAVVRRAKPSVLEEVVRGRTIGSQLRERVEVSFERGALVRQGVEEAAVVESIDGVVAPRPDQRHLLGVGSHPSKHPDRPVVEQHNGVVVARSDGSRRAGHRDVGAQVAGAVPGHHGSVLDEGDKVVQAARHGEDLADGRGRCRRGGRDRRGRGRRDGPSDACVRGLLGQIRGACQKTARPSCHPPKPPCSRSSSSSSN